MPEQLGRVYLGLTDEDAPGPVPDVPQPTPADVSFLLDTVNTADVSREHAVTESPDGVISVIGGKLTEYRYMAEDVVDRAVASGRRVPHRKPATGRRAG